MGGKIAVKNILDINPEAKVIVASGYSDDPILSNHSKYGFSGFLTKPFKIEQISKALHDILDNDK